MKPVHALLLLSFADCAAHEPTPTTRAPVEQLITISAADGTIEGEMRITRDDYVANDRIEAPVNVVWEAMPAAYEAVGLDRPQLDRDNGVAYLERQLVTRRLGDERMSMLIDCGSGVAGPYADSYRIHLTVTTELRPDDAGTAVFTRVDAIGQNTSGTGGDVQCVSRGRLESSIVKALQLAIAQGMVKQTPLK